MKSEITFIPVTGGADIKKMRDENDKEIYNFHYLHYLIQFGHCCGIFPFKLKPTRVADGTDSNVCYKLSKPGMLGLVS